MSEELKPTYSWEELETSMLENVIEQQKQEIATLMANVRDLLVDQEAILKSHTEEQECADKAETDLKSVQGALMHVINKLITAEVEVLRLREILKEMPYYINETIEDHISHCGLDYRAERLAMYRKDLKSVEDALANGAKESSNDR